MSETTCNPCEDYSCSSPILECVTSILLGRISATSTAVYIHIVKQNGAEYIYPTTSDGSGYVTLTTTSAPDKNFYNQFDGLYKVYIMRGGYFADGDKQSVTCPGGSYTTVGLTFEKCNGVQYTTQHVQLI